MAKLEDGLAVAQAAVAEQLRGSLEHCKCETAHDDSTATRVNDSSSNDMPPDHSGNMIPQQQPPVIDLDAEADSRHDDPDHFTSATAAPVASTTTAVSVSNAQAASYYGAAGAPAAPAFAYDVNKVLGTYA